MYGYFAFDLILFKELEDSFKSNNGIYIMVAG